MSEPEAPPRGPSEGALQDRLAAREARLAGLRAGLSDRKRALLGKLVEGHAAAAPIPAVPRRPDAGPAVLSFAQERLWFHDLLEPASPLYNLPAAFRLEGRLEVAVLARALGEIVRRHEALRTVFAAVEGEPRQVAAPAAAVSLPVVDLRALPAVRREEEAWRLAAAEALRPFDLARGPLLRTALLRLEDGAWLALFNLHHIVGDGWSIGLLVGELAALYRAFAAGSPSPLPELAAQYADFAVWQRGHLAGARLAAELEHWRRELAGAPDLLALPADRPRPQVQSYRGGLLRFALPPALAAALAALAEAEGATPFMVLLAGFQDLLGRWSGQEDLLVGSAVANRTRPETEPLIGFFVNLLVLRGRLSGAPTVRELLARTRETALAAFAHQELPFDRLVEELRPARSRGHNPLVQAAFVLQNAPREELELPGLTLRQLPLPAATAKFDLGLELSERGGALAGQLEYARDLFDPATAARLIGGFETLLAGFAARPEARLPDLPLLAAAERHQLLVEWGEAPPAAAAEPAWQGIAARARLQPEAVALELADGSGTAITYAALDRRARRLAAGLRRLGVGPEVRVGLLAERSLDLAAAILGIWQAGGVFLPLDPGLPAVRLAWLVEDALAGAPGSVLLVQRALRDRLAGLPLARVRVAFLPDGEGGHGEPEASQETPEGGAGPDDLAYLIYTSGTTGRPKAVAVEQGSLSHTLAATAAAFGFRAADRMPCLAPFSFDIFLFELLGPLLAGGTVVLFPLRPALDVRALATAVPGCTALHAVPALMREVVEAVAAADGAAPALRLAFVGGDAVPPELLADMRRVFPAARVVVLYGPTEGTILASSHEASAGGAVRLPIGRPLPGARLRVLGPAGAPAPIGVPAELWVGGRGVARGYLGRPELTAEKFVPLPAPAAGGEVGVTGGRWYRSGDLARFRPDGSLEFLGRIDHQVKVRGFRIELGEIESALQEQPEVRAAAVAAREQPGTGSPWLVAYLVFAPEAAAPSWAELRGRLAARLPDYMVPARFVALPALPLTATGKVDRRALPAPGPAAADEGEGSGSAAPLSPAEELLAGLWAGLLGVERVGRHDDFFALGGHSLLATRLVARVREVFGVELPVRALFDAPTVAGLAGLLTAAGEAAPPLRPAARTGALPLSFAQERLWFLDRLEPGGSVYNIPAAVRLAGPLDAAAFGAALDEVVRRHEALRTGFREGVGGRPAQVVLPWQPAGLPTADLSGLAEDVREAAVRRLAREEAARPFDLAAGRPLRASLLRLAAAEHVLLLTVHHIAADGWSVGVLVDELAALYPAFGAGRPSPLPELPVQYADFAVWQREWLAGAVLESQTAFWRQALAGAPALELPTDRPRPAVRSPRGARRRASLPPDLSADLRKLARARGATPFMALLAAFAALLGRLAGQEDLCVGTPIANRTHREVEGLIGFFVNTLVLRAGLAGEPAFDELLRRTREATLAAYAHQDLPFEKLVEELAPVRDASRTPLFQVMFALQEAVGRPAGRDFPDLTATWLEAPAETAKFDLSLALGWSEEGGYAGEVEFSTELFDGATAVRLGGQLAALVAGAVAAPGRSVWELPLLSLPERALLLREWNDSRPAARRPVMDVPRAVVEQARRTPDAMAVAAPDGHLSYGELDRRSGLLAARLRALGVGPEVPVAVCAGRSAALVVALLAVWKAGGAYVPLDPAHPPARLGVVLADLAAEAAMPVVLIQESLRGRLPADGPWRVLPLQAAGAPLPPAGALLPAAAATDRQRAYVIYTSGSTGTPKGVEVEHAALARLISYHLEEFRPGPGDRFTQITNPAFDGLAWEVWSCLAAGATLVVPDEAVRADPRRLLAWLAAESITVSFQTTALAVALLAEAGAGWPAPSLRAFHTGGESLRRVPRDLPFQLINLYGPTECTVLTTTARVRGGDAVPPIGRPITGSRIYLLDRRGEPVPPGLPGELAVGGEGLARGYFGRPDATAERFVPDVWGGEPGARLYRTGDLARWRPDGQLDFLGRLDGQVKIRGFRIELGEVEAALAALPAVREAAVLVWGGGEEAGGGRLVAYVVPREPGGLAVDGLRSWLRSRLPEFMVPASFVVLPALPLTPNGKVDRRALPAPGAGHEGGEEGMIPAAPATPIEELLAGVWAELLGVAEVGKHANFFELGGHSLLATRVASRVREVFGVEVPVRAVFDRPTVAELAELLAAEGGEVGAVPPLLPVPRPAAGKTELPLSFAQERLWFLDRLEPGGSVYNIATAVRLGGPLAAAALGAALDGVVRRHEALRTGFREEVEGRPVQVVEPWRPVGLPVVDLSALPGGVRAAAARGLAAEEAGRPFDLAAGRPVRWSLLRVGSDEHVLLFTLHHIAADGWSVGILVGEAAALYGALREGLGEGAAGLVELSVQYADFAVWQRGWLAGAVLDGQMAFWRQALAGAPALELPADRPRPAVRGPRGGRRPVALPAGLAEDLRRLARGQGATPFMALLGALQVLLGRLAGQHDVLVGTPIANRTRREVEGLIGFFVNTLVLRGRLGGDPDVAEMLRRTREATLAAYAHQDLPFEKLVAELAPVRDASRTPLFQVMFTLEETAVPLRGFGELDAAPVEVEGETAKFDLTLSLGRRAGGGFAGAFEYAAELFDGATVLRLAGQLERLLAGMVADPGRPVADLPILSAAERQQLQVEWNDVPAAGCGRTAATLWERFAARAAQAPEAVAVVQGETRLSYGELAARAGVVARRLRAAGVAWGSRVGLSMERSPELVVGLFGVLAAGGTYVPIDPAYPAERRELMRRDGGLVLVIDREWLAGPVAAAAAPGRGRAVLQALEGAGPLSVPGRAGDGGRPLYAIYTSGSTGRPKGAVVAEGAFAALVDWYAAELGMGEADRHLLLSSASFDLTQKNFFAPLLAGAELHLAPSLYDPGALRGLVERQGITGLNCTPSAFYPLVEEGDPAALASLRTVVLGGEPIAAGRLAGWRRAAGNRAAVLNSYGPTECTDVVAYHRLALPEGGSSERSSPAVPLGRPVPGVRLWIVGAAGAAGSAGFEPAPIGAPGELWIGGSCVGLGYLGDAARTALRFVPDPYLDLPGGRAYRTGDLARRLPSGEIEYLGRIDHQVKVRGVRIELGEVEAALAAHPAVREAAAAAREVRPGDLGLVAYVVPHGATEAASTLWSSELIASLRAALAQRLPAALVPSAYVVLPALPLTPSGKVDRRALPAPGADPGMPGADSAVPRSPVEELLAGIWGELLGVERAGPADDFFALGGHSLLATRLASRIRAAFGVEVPLRRIFDVPTLAGMAAEVAAARQGTAAAEPPLLPASREGRLPLSFAQERLWFLESFDPGNPALNIPLAAELTGRLEAPALVAALGEMVARHESLRTTFEARDGEPFQVVGAPGPVDLPVVDLGALPAAAAGGEAERVAAGELLRGFDLQRGPLLRAVLLRLEAERHRFVLVVHHIVSDGWSMGVLLRELGAAYGALCAGRRPELPPLPVQYPDYAVWQRRVLAAEKRGELEHWLARLGGVQPLELPADRPRPAVQTFRGRSRRLALPAELADRLRAFGRREGATLFMTLVAAAQALLARQSGQDDVLVGTPVAGRRRLETEGLIGFFLNTLVLRTDLAGEPSLRALVGRVRAVTLDAYAHQDVPFEAVLAGLKGERDLSRTPLFQVMFNLLNLPAGEVRLPGLTLAPLPGPQNVPSKFDLTFYVEEREGIAVDLVYNADLFDAARMADFAAQYALLLARAVADPEAPLGSHGLVTAGARAVLPDPRAELGTEWVGPVHGLFAAQARRDPGRLAVAGGDGDWSYGELAEAGGRIAAWLRARGVAREDRVAVWAHRSAPLVPAVLGVLHAGAAFVVLDPAYPAARLVDMLAMAAPRACLRVEAAGPLPAEVAACLEGAGCPQLVLPGGGPAALLGVAGLPAAVAAAEVGPDDLAYVAFTSGSTGAPKGILGRHGPLTHFLPWMRGRFGLSADDRFTLLSGLAHDPLQRDLFTPLCLGAAVLVPDPEEIPRPGRAAAWMARAGATVAHLTPAMAQLLAEPAAGPQESGPAEVPSLRLALLVGEALTRQGVARLRRLAPRVRCVNLFGSTETQRAVGCHVATEEEATGEGGHQVLALGRGMADVQLLVLNRAGGLAGVGEVGEIAVRSPHLARGYLNDPGLTAARFAPAPAGDRLYRTGDLGRYLPDGEVAFAGRGDAQLKVRGFRVEPAEIEAALARHPAVAAAAALLREERGERVLVALVVPRPGQEPAPAALREHLLRELPAYMVPAAYARVAALPRTPTGKIDRRALPGLVPPLAEVLGTGEAAALPGNPTEELIAGLWAGLLRLERVGIHDNFFALGGHSLLATRLVARIREVFGVELPVRALFDVPTVAGLASLVAAGAAGAPAPPLLPVARPASGELPLSFAQERLWFLDRLAPGGSAYNIAAAVRLRGELDVAALAAALGEVVRRHEALRTALREGEGGGPVQVVAPWRPVPLPVADLSALPGTVREAAARRLAGETAGRPFDLAAGRPLRGLLLRTGPAEQVVVLAVHHTAADGWSVGVLVDELAALYGAARVGRPLAGVLPALPVQYADVAVWQRAWLAGAVLEAQVAYWRQALAGVPPLELPADRPRPAVRSARGARRRARLAPGLSEDLRRLARDAGATPFMVLLAGFQALLGRLGGQRDVAVGTAVANRTRREVEGLIGFFANTLVLRGDLAGDPDARTLLARTREAALGAFAHQDLPFEKLVAELAPVRDTSRTPLFQSMLTLQNAPAAAAGFPGLAAEWLEVDGEAAKFDLALALTQGADGGYAGALEYSTDLFDGATVERLLGHFRALLAGMAADPAAPVASLPLLSGSERQALLEWNDTAAHYADAEALLHEAIAAQVRRTPDAVALVFEDGALSYGALAAHAGRLARHLQRSGVGPDVTVGVCLERSLELVVALLAVLEAGGAYLPLDTAYPRERLARMLEDGAPPVVLATSATAAALPPHPGRTVLLDAPLASAAVPAEPAEACRPVPDGLAYVIFTSGSTGRPKGVMNSHRGIVNRLLWMQGHYRIGPGDRVLQKTPASFDVSVWEFFWPLLTGACLVVARPGGHQDPAYLAETLAREEITTLHFVPALLQAFLGEPAAEPDRAAALRQVMASGEALPAALQDRFFARFPGAALHNLYGPTEAAVDVTYWPCAPGAPIVPIGRPVANTVLRLLDAAGGPVPVGAAGELLLGGVQLARGYLGRPDLTAERFVPDPEAGRSAGPGARLYRTGDLARRLPGGEVEFLGRIDHQVKIRGFRVELGEIEAALAADPAVAEAVVVARPAQRGGAALPGDLQLTAYVVPRGAEVDLPALRAGLAPRLPYYMLPAAFVVLPALPLSPNGKVDRRALPDPGQAAGPEAAYEAPRAGVEERLAAVWAEVLGDRMAGRTGTGVGRRDNFFALGGDSLLALRIVHRAREAGLVFTPLQLFERQTVAELAALPGILAEPAAEEVPALAEPPADGGPDISGADFNPDDLARFLADLTGG